MTRALLRRGPVVVALLAALLSPLSPPTGAAFSARGQGALRDRLAAKITQARAAEVKVTAGPTGVLIEWRTSFELDNLGFNIYRDQGGNRTQVNPAIIAGSVLIAGQGTPLYAGYSYQFFDASGSLDTRYYLEDLDLNGAHTLNGPYVPVWNESVPKARQARTISEVAAQASTTSQQTGGPAGIFGQPPTAPAAIQDQWIIAGQPGLKIGVKQNGWYRVTQAEMVAAGFDVSADSRNLRLFLDGREVPTEVSRISGPLGPSDFLEFYGTGLDTLTTDTHVYYLINGSQPGLRLPVFGEIQTSVSSTPAPLSSPVTPLSTDPKAFSTGIWIGDVSSGVVAEREERKQQTIVGGQPPTGTDAFVEDNGVRAPTRRAADSNTPSSSAKALAPEVKTIGAGSKTTSTTKPAMSRNARNLQPKKKTVRRRRSRKRRSHAGALKRRNHFVPAALPTAGFLYDVQLKERSLYFSSLLNGDAENFFGAPIIAPVTRALTVTNLQTDSLGTVQLRIGLQGVSNQTHLVNILLNDVMVGSVSFDSLAYPERTFNLSVSQLHEGSNNIKLVNAGPSGDLILFSYVRLTYPRTFRADNDTISCALRSTQSAKIDGFTTPNIRVLDISDPVSVQEVHPVIESAGSGYALTVPSTGTKAKGSRTLLALPSASFLHPASVVLNQSSTLNQTNNAADLLIITHQSFISLPSLASLVARRQGEGYTVKVVDVEDVFDEFSYGMRTPQAITDFLFRAYSTWATRPRYLLLVGDGTYDYRNYEGAGNFDFVPTKLIDTFFMETGSDDTLADFDGDGIPEIPVGRLPVRTVAEANLALSKIVNFSPSNVPQGALMVADTQGSYFFNFEQANENLIPLLTATMQSNVQKVYRAQEPSDPSCVGPRSFASSSDCVANRAIVNGINQGVALVNYSGHGNVDVWTGGSIFNASDALALTNGNKLPLVIVMDCLNGYFVAPSIDCISEALMKAPNGGAVASFSSSGLTIPTGQHDMGQQLFSLLYSGPPMALGDATRQAKAATTDIDVRRTWVLFGDPTMKIR